MEVTKPASTEAGAARPGAAQGPGARQGVEPPGQPLPTAGADLLDIQPLNVTSALQILIAEIRAALELPFAAPGVQSPGETAQVVVGGIIKALPAEAPDDHAVLAAFDALLARALDHAVAVVSAWHNVPEAAVHAAREASTLISSALADGPHGPIWARPEWAWLAPEMQRYWRRRRARRRPVEGRLSDPDPHPGDSREDRDNKPW